MEPNPCPFCGSDRVQFEYEIAPMEPAFAHLDDGPQDGYVTCCGCGANGPLADTEANAIALWNGAGRSITAAKPPTDQSPVLVYGLHRGPSVARTGWYQAYYGTDGYWYIAGNYALEDVTHWQLLPPAPE